MKIKLLYLFTIFFINSTIAQPNHHKKIVGYYANWAIYARDYNVNKIDGNKLTHINYAFFDIEYNAATPQNTKLKSLDPYADFEHQEGGIPWNADIKGNFYDLRKLKQTFPHLKILISIGGWTKSQRFSPVAASSIARIALAADMARMLVQYPFLDGFDLDWEYPVKGGTDGTEQVNYINIPAQVHHPDDHKNLVLLLKEMRAAMPNKIITVAIGNNVNEVATQFIGPNTRASFGLNDDITTYADFVTFFGYDFGGNWFDKTCYNAPLYPSINPLDPLKGNPNANPPTVDQSMNVLVDVYLNQIGIPKEKLVMGVPFYGKIFENMTNRGTVPNFPGLFVDAPRNVTNCSYRNQPPPGTWDVITCEYGGSVEFCDLAGTIGTNGHHFLDPINPENLLQSAIQIGWAKYWDDTAKVPYLYNATQNKFITYDDQQSINEKAKFIIERDLGGSMIWELSQDTRGENSNVLLTQLNQSITNYLSTDSFDGIFNKTSVFLNNNKLNINSGDTLIKNINVYSIQGQLLFSFNNNKSLNTIVLEHTCFYNKQVFLIELVNTNNFKKTYKVL